MTLLNVGDKVMIFTESVFKGETGVIIGHNEEYQMVPFIVQLDSHPETGGWCFAEKELQKVEE